ncbi:MAG: PCMD domain-containing protein [Bacteroidales bacterium]|nr:PCMD domain-containing protein [Bacteroidales bacterium]
MSKRITYIVLLALGVLALAASCTRTEQSVKQSRGEGYLRFDMGLDLNVQTKAATDPDLNFRIDIFDEGTGVKVRTIEDHHSLLNNDTVSLTKGNYRIAATYGSDVTGFDSPFYTDTTTVAVKVGEVSTATLRPSMKNVMVTVSMDESVTKNFTRYDVNVKNSTTSSEEGLWFYTVNIPHNPKGYISCTGVLYVSIHLTNTDGKENVVSQTISNVQPRDHYKLSYRVNSGVTVGGGVTLDISVDDSMNDQQMDLNLNLDKKPLPVFSESQIADLGETIRLAAGNPSGIGYFQVSASTPIAELWLRHGNSYLGSIGIPASLNLVNATAAERTELNAKGVQWTSFDANTCDAFVNVRQLFAALPVGQYEFMLSVTDSESQYVELPVSVKVMPDMDVTTLSLKANALSVDVKAVYNTDEKPEGVGFQYKTEASSTWIPYTGELTWNGKEFSARISGLSPRTSYQVRTVTATEAKDENIFTATTQGADQIYNMSFDEWYKDGNNYYPCAQGTSADNWWDSANAGATTLGGESNTQPSSDHSVSGNSCRMESKAVVGVFAAGNVYWGKFVGRSGTVATIDQGHPYTCRPKSFHGYYDYAPKTIDKTKAPYTDLKGKMDTGLIYAILTDWTAPNRVKSDDTSTLVDIDNDPHIIGIAKIVPTENTNGQFVEFTVDFEYKSDKQPTYCVICCCASRYADYFTGAVGSVMYVDEFSFVFE